MGRGREAHEKMAIGNGQSAKGEDFRSLPSASSPSPNSCPLPLAIFIAFAFLLCVN